MYAPAKSEPMSDFAYTPVRECLRIGVSALLGIDVSAAGFDCRARGCEVRCAAPLQHRADAELWAAVLHDGRERFGQLYGAPVVRCVRANEGHLLFDLTDALYAALIRETISRLPAPRLVLDDRRTTYALFRMYMLSQKPQTGTCPNDRIVQQAFWTALGIPDALHDIRRLRVRHMAAADALICMFRHLTPAEHTHMLRRSGSLGTAAARLLSLADMTIEQYAQKEGDS